MMGEYLLYYKGKLVGDICDNRIFIKPISTAKEMLPDAEMQPPYNGAKDMIVFENFEDIDLIYNLFERMYSELPESKARKRK